MVKTLDWSESIVPLLWGEATVKYGVGKYGIAFYGQNEAFTTEYWKDAMITEIEWVE